MECRESEKTIIKPKIDLVLCLETKQQETNHKMYIFKFTLINNFQMCLSKKEEQFMPTYNELCSSKIKIRKKLEIDKINIDSDRQLN